MRFRSFFTHLLRVHKKRSAVLVDKLVAAIGVDICHFCAVDVKGRPVLTDHGWTSLQDLSERIRSGTLTSQPHLNQMVKGTICFTYFLALFRQQHKKRDRRSKRRQMAAAGITTHNNNAVSVWTKKVEIW